MTEASPSSFVPSADTWLWDILSVAQDPPLPWFDQRFGFLADALREGKFRRDAAIVPAAGKNSRLASVEIDGGRDVKYVIVFAREVPENWQPGIHETLTFRRDVAGTDLVYDLTGEFMQGKARPFECDLGKLPLRVFAVLPFQLEQIDLAVQQHVQIAAGKESGGEFELPARLRFLDGRGEPIFARLPYYMEMRHSNSGFASGMYLYTRPEEGLPKRFCAPVKNRGGHWTMTIRTLLTGDQAVLPFEVSQVAGGRDKPEISLTSKGLQVRRAPNPVMLEG